MQANKRVVRGAKKICRNGQPVFVNQPVPFLASAIEKECAQGNGEQPQQQKRRAPAAFKSSSREVNRQTTGKQTDRIEDGSLEHVPWSRSGKTLSHVKEICHDENREDGGLGDDETRHADPSAMGKLPSCRVFREPSRECAH